MPSDLEPSIPSSLPSPQTPEHELSSFIFILLANFYSFRLGRNTFNWGYNIYIKKERKEQFLSVVAPPTFFPNDWIKRPRIPISPKIEEK